MAGGHHYRSANDMSQSGRLSRVPLTVGLAHCSANHYDFQENFPIATICVLGQEVLG
jgi:hypothetical protein